MFNHHYNLSVVIESNNKQDLILALKEMVRIAESGDMEDNKDIEVQGAMGEAGIKWKLDKTPYFQ